MRTSKIPSSRIDERAVPGRLSRFRGSLLGGAVGDALGAPVEFMALPDIRKRYGPGGIRDMDACYGRRGALTDDTQMTLFTAEGLLRARPGDLSGDQEADLPALVASVHASYLRWFRTQGEDPSITGIPLDGRLLSLPELHSRRAPGNTCLSALRGASRLGEAARNDSKGCGGVMRVAPAGLWTAARGASAERAFALGRDCAGLTHGHPTGKLPAGFLAALVRLLATGAGLEGALRTASEVLRGCEGRSETEAAVEEARGLASSSLPAGECLARLGEGWVAEEALAIALFCSLRAGSFEEGLTLAVNITGDSDSTGAIAGNILGAHLGEGSIPRRWLEPLELRGEIERMAGELAGA